MAMCRVFVCLVPPRMSESHYFSDDPQLVVISGLPLIIRCPAIDSLPLNISWLKDGNWLAFNEETLNIDSTSVTDSGNYTCIASNKVGSVSKSFIVDVHSKYCSILLFLCTWNLR